MIKQIGLLLFSLMFMFSCKDGKQVILGETPWQRDMNAAFKDASQSPLKDKDRRNFTTLDFFPVDSTYVVKAHLTRTPDALPFKMKTTTERLPEYVQYGILTFELNGATHQLRIYQNLDLVKESGKEELLFLPFLDTTNGETTYGGGRYIDTKIPQGDTLWIDFNQAYNPYCVYNENYSCPIVPLENTVNTEVKAGVKAYKKY
ncbi:MAG TPA: DUF1684 domain-containing protein [Flavobacteriaceae bacterium]|nr:DUF1684 domain-containing protein [Flavobacteriaceae bacterium]